MAKPVGMFTMKRGGTCAEYWRQQMGNRTMRAHVRKAIEEMREGAREFERTFASQLEELVYSPGFQGIMRRWMRSANAHRSHIMKRSEAPVVKGANHVGHGKAQNRRMDLNIVDRKNRAFLRTARLKRVPCLPSF
ncbi:MAG: hypothetical protein A3I44_03790 [Candidatus Sungbacteria bacterium RIFCSPLOWO2_02_FULL_51_17]|uniref:Uncharacterized protein n=1 Tax=Candidatus Sungbacteria bacterium RIFCSPHIGHO2_02_FULL_51_29 TaxID=1802273 RepID=A0A1G2KQ04_9BACT|nr:MAG: hypothetical protein A2676_02310 [Candidatus Sungbacteria bacterium RIFCSPHIGHO2_01_FULL_51_22]OHA01486.1 MAG: hypothetical protein A3C16_05575 [Candidatus Sungbacteria bacterium RIFCSPHIGHO2_02_FULL_51_29]OHA11209.1 MAG: hypothetical protein A3I44_03790 [Candidatus Sungbacteria bacterium RIFCSPLOWO2_02_FULL_51_17]